MVGGSTARAVPRVVGELSHEREPVHVVGRSRSRDFVASRVLTAFRILEADVPARTGTTAPAATVRSQQC